jgi:hypothetical protein
MFWQHTRSVVAVSWVAIALTASWAIGASSWVSLLLVAIVSVLPPAVMLALWSDGPPPTIAEVLFDVEKYR